METMRRIPLRFRKREEEGEDPWGATEPPGQNETSAPGKPCAKKHGPVLLS